MNKTDTPAREAELLVADAVGDVIEHWGFRRVLGRVWTVLFIAAEALSAAEIGERLQLSSGAMSMALTELQRWWEGPEFAIYRSAIQGLVENELQQATELLDLDGAESGEGLPHRRLDPSGALGTDCLATISEAVTDGAPGPWDPGDQTAGGHPGRERAESLVALEGQAGQAVQ